MEHQNIRSRQSSSTSGHRNIIGWPTEQPEIEKVSGILENSHRQVSRHYHGILIYSSRPARCVYYRLARQNNWHTITTVISHQQPSSAHQVTGQQSGLAGPTSASGRSSARPVRPSLSSTSFGLNIDGIPVIPGLPSRSGSITIQQDPAKEPNSQQHLATGWHRSVIGWHRPPAG